MVKRWLEGEFVYSFWKDYIEYSIRIMSCYEQKINGRKEDVLLHLECFFDIRMFMFSKSKQNTFFTKRRREMFHGAKDPNSSFKIFDPFFYNSSLLFTVE